MANTAPIYSQANEERAQAESADWARFSSPRDTSEFCASWLAILCSQIDRVSGALLVLGPDQGGGGDASAGVRDVAVVLDVAHTPERELQRKLRLLHWASAWLVAQFRQQSLEVQETRLARISLVSDLVATAVQERRFGSAALAVVNDLAARLQCDRARVGFA